MRSRVWWINRSVSAHCCFSESLVVFAEKVTEAEAENALDYSQWKPDRIGSRNVLETLDIEPQERARLLDTMRSVHDTGEGP